MSLILRAICGYATPVIEGSGVICNLDKSRLQLIDTLKLHLAEQL